MANTAGAKPCEGCGTLTTDICWADCGMSLCTSPLCSDCYHVDEKYGWRHERRTPDLIPRADAELAVAEAFRRAAEEAASEGWPGENRLGVSEREEGAMDCADRIETAILALAPADALAEVQRLRQERDAALARVEKLHHLITEASDPDFIWGAMDNVHDAETTLDDYAAAVSRAIRAALDEDARDAKS